ncbi:substrate-binding domain-containing protein [Streptomyces sp. cg40]|uniref:substrate-binding domain-containing protein n=1 Tax=Streptomyces sp. cg40 TaxID=3419764 RepID=UPI003D03393D
MADRGALGANRPPEPVQPAGPAEPLCTRVLPALAPLTGEGVRLRISAGLTDDLLDGLWGGRYDLVIATARSRWRTLAWEPPADEEFVLLAAPAWAERIGVGPVAAEGPAALRGVPLVSYAENLPIDRRYWRHEFGTRLGGQTAITVPDLRGVLVAVVAGAGISVLPRYLCLDELASGAPVPLLTPKDPINTTYLTRRPGSPDNPHVTLVRERLLCVALTW